MGSLFKPRGGRKSKLIGKSPLDSIETPYITGPGSGFFTAEEVSREKYPTVSDVPPEVLMKILPQERLREIIGQRYECIVSPTENNGSLITAYRSKPGSHDLYPPDDRIFAELGLQDRGSNVEGVNDLRISFLQVQNPDRTPVKQYMTEGYFPNLLKWVTRSDALIGKRYESSTQKEDKLFYSHAKQLKSFMNSLVLYPDAKDSPDLRRRILSSLLEEVFSEEDDFIVPGSAPDFFWDNRNKVYSLVMRFRRDLLGQRSSRFSDEDRLYGQDYAGIPDVLKSMCTRCTEFACKRGYDRITGNAAGYSRYRVYSRLGFEMDRNSKKFNRGIEDELAGYEGRKGVKNFLSGDESVRKLRIPVKLELKQTAEPII